MAITRQLVELMDGEITADSIYTKGTVFTVLLKQRIVDASPVGELDFAKRDMAEHATYQPSFEAPDARILVVDDNRMNLACSVKQQNLLRREIQKYVPLQRVIMQKEYFFGEADILKKRPEE